MNNSIRVFLSLLFIFFTIQCNDKPKVKDSGLFKMNAEKLEASCSAEGGRSCTAIGRQYKFGTYGHAIDYQIASDYFRKGCDSGDAYGCKELGLLAQNGQGMPQDVTMATTLYKSACENKVSIACHYLGEMYRQGRELTRDFKKARHYYEKACKLGSKWSCTKATELQ